MTDHYAEAEHYLANPSHGPTGPTGPTGADLHKQNGPTAADSQSGQLGNDHVHRPTDGPTDASEFTECQLCGQALMFPGSKNTGICARCDITERRAQQNQETA